MASGTLDLTKRIPALAAQMNMPMESVAAYSQVSTTQLRRWLAGGKGATQSLKAIYDELKQLKAFCERCPVEVNVKKVSELLELRRRIKAGELYELVQDFKAALLEFEPSAQELTQEERAQFASVFAPCPVSFDNPKRVRDLLAQIREGSLIVGISANGVTRVSTADYSKLGGF